MSVTIERFDDPRVPILPTHSHAVRVGDTIYVAGQVGIRKGEATAPEEFTEEVEVALDALEWILEAAGAMLETVVRTNCYLSNIDDMQAFNEVYLKRFGDLKPARTTIQSRLAHDLRFEIDAVAIHIHEQ